MERNIRFKKERKENRQKKNKNENQKNNYKLKEWETMHTVNPKKLRGKASRKERSYKIDLQMLSDP